MNKDLQKQVHATAQALAVQLLSTSGISGIRGKDAAQMAINGVCEMASKSALDMHKNLQVLMDDSIKKNIQIGDVIKCYHEKTQGQTYGIFSFSESGNPVVRMISANTEGRAVSEDVELESWQWEFVMRPEISFG